MSAAELTVYSTPTCRPCTVAKKRLDAEGIAYNPVDLTEAPEVLASLKKRLDRPQIQTPLFEWRGELSDMTALRDIIAEAKATGPAS